MVGRSIGGRPIGLRGHCPEVATTTVRIAMRAEMQVALETTTGLAVRQAFIAA